MRVLVDAHGDGFWGGTSTTSGWAPCARCPARGAEAERAAGVARTEAWGRRMLNTQLASWAELRHDTILYAKQSYTGGASCEFPDALVDPNPAFFARLRPTPPRARR